MYTNSGIVFIQGNMNDGLILSFALAAKKMEAVVAQEVERVFASLISSSS